MANILKIKRGLKADISKLTLVAGELAVALDTQELYVGDNEGNVKIIKGGAAGAVESADKLTVARTITATGDATGSTSFDGSENVEMALTLATSGVTAGTYSKVTVDAKGRVITGASLDKADLPTIVIEDIEGLSEALGAKATKEELKNYVKTADLPKTASYIFPYEKSGSDVVVTNWNADDIQSIVNKATAGDPFTLQLKLENGKIYNGYITKILPDFVTIPEGNSYLGLVFPTGPNHLKPLQSNGVYFGEDVFYCYNIFYNTTTKAVTEYNFFGQDVYNYICADPSTGRLPQLAKLSDLAKKVDKVEGKALSTNDFTNELKAKLEGLSNYDDTAIKADIAKKADATSISTALEGKVDKVEGKVLSSNDYTTAEKEKLAGLSNYNDTEIKADIAKKANATDVYTQTQVNTELGKKADKTTVESLTTTVNGKANKATTISGYGITDAYTKKEVDAKVTSVYKYKASVANEAALPTGGQVVGDVYNLEDTGMNVAWTGEGWDKLGSVVDLTPYLTKEDAGKTYAAKATTLVGYGITDAYTKSAVNTELDKKVDKEIGKQLSTNDYTTAEKTKLTGIATGAEVNKIDAVKVNGTALGITDKAVNIDLSNYATKSTTLVGYGITNAYTKDEVNTALGKKANSSDVYTKTEVNNSLANKLSKTDVIDGGTF